MVEYRCFKCGKSLNDEDTRRNLRCPYCGYKIFYKPRQTTTKVQAR